MKETKKVYAGMLLASKNLSLYPPGHSIPVKSIKQFHQTLEAYLQKYEYLRLEIERNRIVSLDEEISSEPHEEGTLPFTLFRDGIRWIEFNQGIDLEEIKSFLTIVNQHMILSSEPEGDIVTNIWEAQFSHIQYDVADFFVNADGEMKDSISSFKAELDLTEPGEKNLGEKPYDRQPEIDPVALILSEQEQEQLQEMIHFEEEADFSSYVNALLDILLLYRDEESFRTILEVLSEEFTGTLAREEFDISLKIVWGLRKIVEQYRKQMPWAVPIAENFFQKASDVDSLSPILQTWNHINAEQTDILEQIFKYLDGQAIRTLALLLADGASQRKKQILSDSIIVLAGKNMRPLEDLLDHSDEKLVDNLIPIIVQLEKEKSLHYLMKLLHRDSSLIREKAIREIMDRGLVPLREVFEWIDDPDEVVRRLVMRQLGKKRDSVIEALFLAYLGNTTFQKDQADHVMVCFKTLGRCGSLRSIPYLREILLNRKWLPGFWRALYRRGAVVALEALSIPESEQLLDKARRSLHPSLRIVFRDLSRENQKKKGDR
ncbi:MAG: HEAT repeat domain-containing protein [Smithellaceae bacterium]|nr:HEAT repeat domain-containing protein [Smithellaceae bacterium]